MRADSVDTGRMGNEANGSDAKGQRN